MALDERITELEIRVEEQERMIDQLSKSLAEQWSVVEKLEIAVKTLSGRFANLEDFTNITVPVTRPPHW